MKYPELDIIAEKLVLIIIFIINLEVKRTKSNMPYKAQYVLEELIEKLSEKV